MLRSIFQTDAWAAFKEQFGWRAYNYEGLIGLERVLGFNKRLLYFPELPLDERSLALIGQLRHEKPTATRIFTRFEFLELWTHDKAKTLLEAGLIRSFEDVQPDYRQWIVLDKTEEELLKAMKPKGRYNLRVAERKNLTVEWGTTPELVEQFYALYQQTAKRTGFQGRNQAYFQAMVQQLATHSLGQVLVVRHQDEVVSAAIVSFFGGVASYLYGGSGGDRSLMAPYLMHWEAIKRAKKEGCVVYDLLAIAPPEAAEHVHAGLTRFKTQFGGESVRLLGSWDLVHNRFWYTLYRFVETKRRRAI